MKYSCTAEHYAAHIALHVEWIAAIGTPEYDRKAWVERGSLLHAECGGGCLTNPPPLANRKEEAMKRIPIAAAKKIAEQYDYDQVIIIARKVGVVPGAHGEHIASYGVSKEHCDSAAKQVEALKNFMGWPSDRLPEERVAVFAGPPDVRALDGVPADATHVVACVMPGCGNKARISTRWTIAVCESCLEKREA